MAGRDPTFTAAGPEELIARGFPVALQRADAQRAAGMPAGWKIGINAPEVRAQLGLASPVIGCLDGAAFLSSGAAIELPAGADIRVEAEVALRVGRKVSPDADIDEVRGAIAAIAPVLEVVDQSQPSGSLEQIMQHSVFHRATVLGPETDWRGATPPELGRSLPRVFRDGDEMRQPRADLVPEDLCEIVVHTARFLARFSRGLAVGDWILSGSYVNPIRLRAGNELRVDFGALGQLFVRAAS